jgi:hypothetical protein
LRALVAVEADIGLPAGWYLVGAVPPAGELTTGELQRHLRAALDQVRSR